MNIDDIYKARVACLRDNEIMPDYVLLTHAEYDSLCASTDALRHFNTAVREPSVAGLNIVIEGSGQHRRLERAGVRFLRPNNQGNRRA